MLHFTYKMIILLNILTYENAKIILIKNYDLCTYFGAIENRVSRGMPLLLLLGGFFYKHLLRVNRGIEVLFNGDCTF